MSFCFENIKLTKHLPARRNNSKGLPNDKCEMSAVTELANVAKRNHFYSGPSAVLLQTQLLSTGRRILLFREQSNLLCGDVIS